MGGTEGMSARNTAHVSNQQWIIAVLIAMTKNAEIQK